MGKIIIFEGLPGSGKTTISKKISEELKLIRVGEIIGKDYKEIKPADVGDVHEKFFFDSDKRKYHLARKHSQKGYVLMDRSYLSTIAYNLCFDDAEYRKKILDIAKELKVRYEKVNIIYIFLDIDPFLSLERKEKEDNPINNWSSYDNLKKTSEYYKNELKSRNNVIFIDGSGDFQVVYKEILSHVLKICS